MSEVEFVKALEKSGFVRQQAEAQVKVMSDFTKNVATKDDLERFATKADLRYEILLVNARIDATANTIIVKLGSLMVALFAIAGTVATIVGLWLAKI